MELRHLRYFVAVGEEENVSRAAKRLHVSQPPLSRQIRDLESELGLALFVHKAKAIRLTEVGRIFLSEARAALQRVDDAVAFTKAFGNRQTKRLRVAHMAAPTLDVLPRALNIFQRVHPEAKVELHQMSIQKMVRALHCGDVDVGFALYELSEDFQGLIVQEISSTPLRVAVNRKHRFARLKQVFIGDVAKEQIIALTRANHRWYHFLLERLLLPYCRELNIVEEHDSAQSIFAAIEAGRGIGIANTMIARTAGQRLLFLPLKPAPKPLPIVLAFRAEGSTALRNDFIEAALKASVRETKKARLG